MRYALIFILAFVLLQLAGCSKTDASIESIALYDDGGYLTMYINITSNDEVEIALKINDIEIDSDLISKRRFEDEEETVAFRVCDDRYENPGSGVYEVIVYDTDNVIDDTTITYAGPALVITNFIAEASDLSYSDYSGMRRYMTSMAISYTNIGDQPAYVDRIYMDGFEGTTSKSLEDNAKYIAPDSSRSLAGSMYFRIGFPDCVDVYLMDAFGNALSRPYVWVQ